MDVEGAARRFGNPDELAAELEGALPRHERISYFVERWFGWRAPESVVRYALRQAFVTFCILAVILPLVAGGTILGYGWFEGVWTFLRVLGAIVLVTPPAQFMLTLTWIKMRDALWGVFGSRKSLVAAVSYGLVSAVVVMVSFFGFAWAAHGDFHRAIEALMVCTIAGAAGGSVSFLLACLLGPSTIRDTHWALLDIEAV